MENSISTRRYDIDWLRVIAIALLLIYHISIGFQPWGVFIRFIQNNQSLDWLWTPMAMLNVWRIPLLFFVSGMGVCFAIRKRNWKELMKERSLRILLPFIFGAVAIVPLHNLLWQDYYNQDLSYAAGQGHLWFLLNIFVYVIVLSPVFFYLKRNAEGKIIAFLTRIYSNPISLLSLVSLFVLESFTAKPEMYTLYAFTWHGFFMGFIAFLLGFSFVMTGNAFWQTVLKWRWLYLSIATAFYMTRIFYFKLSVPNYLVSVESLVWIFAIFGFAYKYLNKPSKALNYLSQGAYPIYIIHMVLMFLASYIIFPMQISAMYKLMLTVLITFSGCFILYEFLIRRVRFIRPLFGLKNKQTA